MNTRVIGAPAAPRGLRGLAGVLVLALVPLSVAQTRWTYQGRLDDGGSAADGAYDFEFKLYDAAAGGATVGPTVSAADVAVADGLFSVVLDFGNVFDCDNLWLEIGVRAGDSGGAYTTLAPRQEVTSAPHAIFACAAADLVLPFEGSASSNLPAFKVTNTGIGKAGHFEISNAGNGTDALHARTNGSGMALYALQTGSAGRAGYFVNNNAANSAATLYAQNGGLGQAGIFEITDSDNDKEALWAYTAGAGRAGTFQIANAANVDDALTSTTNGTGDAGVFTISNAASIAEAVEASSSGGGNSIESTMTGTGRAGYFAISNTSNHGVALEARTNAVNGTTIDGVAIRGWATSASGDETYGLWGESAAANGRGVYGKASSTSTTGVMFGGFFESAGELGVGVHAVQTATASSSGTVGFGMWGSCTAARTGANSAGVRGTNYGTEAIPPDEFPPIRYGVWGETMGYGYGVFGHCYATSGIGVRGEAPTIGVSGLATAASGVSYGVLGQSDSTGGYGGQFRASASGGIALYTINEPNVGPIIEAWNNGDREFYVDSSGDVKCDGAFTGGGADFAERLPAAEPGTLEPGDVVVFGDRPREMTLARHANDPRVVGVYSTKPGFLGGGAGDGPDLDDPGAAPHADTREHLPVALVGIVPVKISGEGGAVRIGDLLTSSNTPGHAMRAAPIGELGGRPVFEQGTLIGKAMEDFEGDRGRILMLVLPR